MTDKTLASPPVRSQAKSRLFTPYVLGWSLLALVSLAYLSLLALKPAAVADVLGAGSQTAEAETKEIVSEVHTLRQTIDLFRNELIQLRSVASAQTDAAQKIAARVESLETATAEMERVAAAAQEAKGAKGKDKDKDKIAKAAEPAPAAAPAQKTAKDQTPASKKTAKQAPDLETGSVATPAAAAPAAPPITFGPATVTTTVAVPPSEMPTPTNSQIGVQIATGPSIDSLRLSWTLLNERHGDRLRALQPRYTSDASGPEQSYDLVVGPLADIDDARRLCQELALKATPCAVSRFGGSAL